MFNLVRGDVEAAVKSNHAYLTIHNLAVAERAIYDKINRFPEFWTLNSYALQTTFFIAFGRIFDSRHDSLSVQKLVDATIANPNLFSKAALRERKRRSLNLQGSDPDWLAEYVLVAWEPTEVDLRSLRDALAPHWDKFRSIYGPIRHKAFAHRSNEDEAAIAALFGRTLIGDVSEILRFLHTVLWAIWEMAWNARRPDLADFHDYEAYVRRVKAKIEEFIRRLP
ncbi:MAG: hypothetical protein ACLQGV_12730 [Bryobacteraceae bacterium]